MGLFNQDDIENSLSGDRQERPIAPSFSAPQEQAPLNTFEKRSLFARAAENNNWFISLLHNGIGNWTTNDPSFNVAERIKDTKYQAHPDYFVNVDNEKEFDDARRQVDELNQYHELMSRAPTLGFWSSLGWGAADPMMMIPAVGSVKVVKTGSTIAKTAALSSAATAGAFGVEEATMQGSQPERTATDSLTTIAAGALVGGLIGGAVAKFSNEAALLDSRIANTAYDVEQHKAAIKTVLDAGYDYTPTPQEEAVARANMQANINQDIFAQIDALQTDTPLAETIDKSAGAGHVELDAKLGLPNWAVKAVTIPGLRPINLEGMMSPSSTVREFTSSVFAQHLPLEQNLKSGGFKPTNISMDYMMSQDMRKQLDWNKSVNDAYMRYLQIDPDSFGAGAREFIMSKKLANGGKYMTKKEFNEEVINALNNGAIHQIPEIDSLAKQTKNYLDDLWKFQQEFDLEVKDRPPLPDYFMRSYNVPWILDNRLKWEKDIAADFMSKVKADVKYVDKDGNEQIAKSYFRPANQKLDWTPSEGEKLVDYTLHEPLSAEEAMGAARDMTDNIVGFGKNTSAITDLEMRMMNAGLKPRKHRTVDVPYSVLKPGLINDLESLMQLYTASVSKWGRFKQMLQSKGVKNIDEYEDLIRQEFDAKRAEISSKKPIAKEEKMKLPKSERNKYMTAEEQQKKITKLDREYQASLNQFRTISAIALGQYKKKTPYDHLWRMSDQYNATRLLGGVLVSSLNDAGASLVRYSLPDNIWYRWLGGLQQMVTMTKSLKQKDLADMMIAIGNEMDDSIRWLMNPDMEASHYSKAEKATKGFSGLYMKSTGITWWTNLGQRLTATMAEARILRNLNKGWDAISDREKRYLAELGIDDKMGKAIHTMQQRYGQDIRGTHISNVRQWSPSMKLNDGITGQQAKDHFMNALWLEANKAPIMTQRGDLPAIVHRYQAFRSMFLFKGFPAAATTKLTLNMMSQGRQLDPRALTGLVGLVSLGMLSYIIGNAINGRKSDLSLFNLILKGWDRSGAGGLITDPFMQIKYDYDQKKRYGNRAWFTSPLEYLAGPNSSIIQPVYSGILSAITGEKMDKRTEFQLKALWPYQNYFLLNLLKNKGKTENVQPYTYRQ